MNSDIIWFAVFVGMLILPMLGNHVFNKDYHVFNKDYEVWPYRPSFKEKVFSCCIWWFLFGIVAVLYLMNKYYENILLLLR